MRYPAECPVFEVVETGYTWRRGAVLVGEGVDSGNYLLVCAPDLTEISRAAQRRAKEDPGYYDRGFKKHGRVWSSIHHDQLRPLTRAAREMLALVRR